MDPINNELAFLSRLLSPFLYPFRRKDGPHIADRLVLLALREVGIAGGEGGKVVLPDDRFGRLLHGREVKRPVQGVDIAGEEGRADLSTEDPVLVALSTGTVT